MPRRLDARASVRPVRRDAILAFIDQARLDRLVKATDESQDDSRADAVAKLALALQAGASPSGNALSFRGGLRLPEDRGKSPVEARSAIYDVPNDCIISLC